MYKILLIAFLIVSCFSLKVEHQNGVPGGWNTRTNPRIDTFIRNQLPILKDATLIDGKQQVVAGIQYQYNYQDQEGSKWQVTVIQQSWLGITKIIGVEKLGTDKKTKQQSYQGVEVANADFTTLAREIFKI